MRQLYYKALFCQVPWYGLQYPCVSFFQQNLLPIHCAALQGRQDAMEFFLALDMSTGTISNLLSAEKRISNAQHGNNKNGNNFNNGNGNNHSNTIDKGNSLYRSLQHQTEQTRFVNLKSVNRCTALLCRKWTKNVKNLLCLELCLPDV